MLRISFCHACIRHHEWIITRELYQWQIGQKLKMGQNLILDKIENGTKLKNGENWQNWQRVKIGQNEKWNKMKSGTKWKGPNLKIGQKLKKGTKLKIGQNWKLDQN